MKFTNHVQIERKPDHFVLRFSVSSSAAEAEELVTTFAVPLTTGMELALGLFEGMILSVVDLQQHIGAMQRKVNELNHIAAAAQAKAAMLQTEGGTK